MLGEQLAAVKIIKGDGRPEGARTIGLISDSKARKANAFVTFLPSMVRGLLEFLAFVGLALMFVLGSKGMGVAVGNVFVVLALFARLFRV